MTQLNLDKIKAHLERAPREFKNIVAQIGIPKGPHYADGTSVAYVATIQEFGAPSVGIPPRPFMRPTVAAKKAKWVQEMAGQIPKVVNNSITAFDVLDHVGRVASLDMKNAVKAINSPALSPVTVLLRKWKKDGRTITGTTVVEARAAIERGVDPGGDDKPLNATGLMQQSLLHSVAAPGAEFSV